MSDEDDLQRKDAEPDEEAPKPPPRGLAVVAWGLVLFFACRLLEILLEAQATASAVGQAVLVEWATSKLGVAWSDPHRKHTTADVAKRAGLGAGIGLGAAIVLVALLLTTHGALADSVPNVSIPVLVIGLVTAGLHAWRDELLLHGVVLRALGMFEKDEHRERDLVRVAACGLTSAGAALGRSDASAHSVVVAGIIGLGFGALWVRDRGAWMPWAANLGLHFTLDTLMAGGLSQLKLAANAWSGGDNGILAGTAAVIVFGTLATAGVFTTVRRMSPEASGVG